MVVRDQRVLDGCEVTRSIVWSALLALSSLAVFGWWVGRQGGRWRWREVDGGWREVEGGRQAGGRRRRAEECGRVGRVGRVDSKLVWLGSTSDMISLTFRCYYTTQISIVDRYLLQATFKSLASTTTVDWCTVQFGAQSGAY